MDYRRILRYQNVQLTHDIVETVHDETRRIQKHYPHTLSCSVSLSKPHRKHHKGDGVRAQVSLALPGRRLVSTKDASGHSESENALTAILDAFDAAERMAHAHLQRRHPGRTRLRQFEPVAA